MYSLHSSLFTLIVFIFVLRAPAPTVIYTLSLHDALPISSSSTGTTSSRCPGTRTASTSSAGRCSGRGPRRPAGWRRSEEHTSELQSRGHLVCRLLLEKKNKTSNSKWNE